MNHQLTLTSTLYIGYNMVKLDSEFREIENIGFRLRPILRIISATFFWLSEYRIFKYENLKNSQSKRT